MISPGRIGGLPRRSPLRTVRAACHRYAEFGIAKKMETTATQRLGVHSTWTVHYTMRMRTEIRYTP
jgi:hypothetical protein